MTIFKKKKEGTMEENKESLNENGEKKGSPEEKKDKKDDKQLAEEQIKKLEADCEHWKNAYYKAYADMANLRKIIRKLLNIV